MAPSSDSPKGENTYLIDADSAAEMARLMNLDHLVTQTMGRLLPERSTRSGIRRILDIGCGPGAWVLEVAFAYPEIEVIGIDISPKMIEYAQAQAQVRRLGNARFQVMNALTPFAFPAASFDLVNARFIAGFMLPGHWPSFLQECLRVLRPGGTIRLSEGEGLGITTSAALEQLNTLLTRASLLAGRSFCTQGRDVGIVAVLGRFLREAGCQHICHQAHAIDFSVGMPAHAGWYQNYLFVLNLLQPFLVKMEVTTPEAVEQLCQQALAEMLIDSFCGVGFFLSVWGEIPG